VVDIMEALRRSLEGGGTATRKRAPAKRAPAKPVRGAKPAAAAKKKRAS